MGDYLIHKINSISVIKYNSLFPKIVIENIHDRQSKKLEHL